METKKSFKADLGNKRGLLLEIGLVVALVFVVAAFAYTPKEYRIEQRSLAYAPVVDVQMTEITREKPREAVRKVEIKPIGDVIQIVRNDRKILTDIPLWRNSTSIPRSNWFLWNPNRSLTTRFFWWPKRCRHL